MKNILKGKIYEILIVDDTIENIRLLDENLTNKGYKVRIVTDGQSALDSIALKKPDLILLDIKMPGMDGYEVCEKLKQDDDTASIPIIFLSAMDDSQSKIKAFEVGGVDYITKPFSNQEVLARVSNHLNLSEYMEYLQQINEEKERLMFQQSKMAQMGELIGNIAHQWKQPISVVIMIINNIKSDLALGLKTQIKDEMDQIEDIQNTMNFLSQTIDDFQSFFSPSKKKMVFNAYEAIEKNKIILKTTFKHREIQIIEDVKGVEIEGYLNEFAQALMIILNNAKDVLETIETPRYLFLDIVEEDNNAVIKIKDNGGGVNEEIIDKVFEPYVTTKSEKQGTGIGLYISKQIIEEHMGGTINVKNIEYEYENQTCKGAEFIVTVPKYQG